MVGNKLLDQVRLGLYQVVLHQPISATLTWQASGNIRFTITPKAHRRGLPYKTFRHDVR